MPKRNRTTIENTIKAAVPDICPSDLRRATKLLMRRDEMPSHEEALMLVKAITYTDETGDIACGLRPAA